MRFRSGWLAEPGQGVSTAASLRRARPSSCPCWSASVPGSAAFLKQLGAMSRFAPADLDELRDAIGEPLAVEAALAVVAGGSKRRLDRPLQVPRMLASSRLAGIRDFQ